MAKSPFVKDSLLRTGLFYTASSLLYLWIVSASTSGSGNINSLAGMIAVKLLILLAFSAVFGFSYFVFGKNIMPTAQRALHVIILMIAWVAAFILLGNIGDSVPNIVMSILVALGLYFVAYPLGILIHHLIKKIK